MAAGSAAQKIGKLVWESEPEVNRANTIMAYMEARPSLAVTCLNLHRRKLRVLALTQPNTSWFHTQCSLST